MNENSRLLCKKLRAFDDASALLWIETEFPANDPEKNGVAIVLIPHRTWKRSSQIKLAYAYIPALFPNGFNRAVRCFDKVMSVHLLVKVIWNVIKDDEEKLQIANYWLPRIRRDAKDEQEIVVLSELIKKVKEKIGVKSVE